MPGPAPSTRDTRHRFERNTSREGGHLLWKGRLNRYGTGRLKVWVEGRGWRETPARRVAYELFIGSVPADKNVADTCGVAACVEPSHLRLIPRGSQGQHYRLSDDYRQAASSAPRELPGSAPADAQTAAVVCCQCGLRLIIEAPPTAALVGLMGRAMTGWGRDFSKSSDNDLCPACSGG